MGRRSKQTKRAALVAITPATAPTNAPVTVQARYDAAGNGRRVRNWMPPSTGPNRAITGLQRIRDRSRDTVRNDWAGESSVQKWTTNLVGIGITPRFKRVKSKDRKQAIVDLWSDWVKVADADGVLNFYGLQTLAVRAWLEAGEVFLRLRPRSEQLGLPVPFQVQLVEAEFVPLFDADTWTGMPPGNTIRQGIERNKYSRRIAYWMYKEHPGDNGGTISPVANQLVRVPAEQVKHIYMPARPGALRGVSSLAAVLTRLRNIGDYDDAVLDRQKLANLFTLFITRPMPDGYNENVNPLTGLPIETDNDGPIATLAPGLSQELAPGEDVKFANPPEAGTTYSDYMRTQNMGTAAGTGIPYEIMSGDIVDVSDRTLRVLINEFRRFAEQRQYQVIIPMMCEPVMEGFAAAGVLAGLIAQSEFEDVKRAEWSPDGWQYIHPVQDVEGKAKEVEVGFRSRSSVIAENGDDAEQVDDERSADQKREKALGIEPKPLPMAAGAGAPPKPQPA